MPKKEPLTTRIEIRCSEELKTRLTQVALMQGRSVSDIVVEAVFEKTNQIIKEQQIINLTVKEAQAFAHALANPPEPNQYLLEAGNHYKKMTEKK